MTTCSQPVKGPRHRPQRCPHPATPTSDPPACCRHDLPEAPRCHCGSADVSFITTVTGDRWPICADCHERWRRYGYAKAVKAERIRAVERAVEA